MTKYTGFRSFLLILLLSLFATAALAVGPQDRVLVTKSKGVTLTNHSAISTSIAVGSCTAINMAQWTGGAVQAVRATGTGTVSIQLLTCETLAGTYCTAYSNSDAMAIASYPAMETTDGDPNRSWSLKGVRSKYIKLVPTISGTATYTILFTPASD